MKHIQFFLRLLSFITIISHLFLLPLFPQDVTKLMNYAETYQFDKLEDAIKKLEGKEKENAAVLYLRALIETDADKALATYNRVLELDTKTITAEKSLWRVAQYYYIKGLYFQSADVLKRIIIHFPDSFYADKAQKQIIIIRDEFGERIKSTSTIDDEKTSPEETKPTEISTLSTEGKRFVVQLGAFGINTNALKWAAVLKERGLKNVIVKAQDMPGRMLHLVWYGNFKTKMEAQKRAEQIKKALGIHYIIVELN